MRDDFVKRINGDFQEPVGIIQKRIIYSLSRHSLYLVLARDSETSACRSGDHLEHDRPE